MKSRFKLGDLVGLKNTAEWRICDRRCEGVVLQITYTPSLVSRYQSESLHVYYFEEKTIDHWWSVDFEKIMP